MIAKKRDVAKIVLLDPKKRVLLQLREKDQSNAGTWSLFGGGIEAGETPREAVKREVQEEVGYTLKQVKKLCETTTPDGKRFWYVGHIDAPLSKLQLTEGADFQFFDAKELKNIRLNPRIKEILKKIP